MKKKRNPAKSVTLPISNKKIFEELANFAFEIEGLPESERKAFVHHCMTELGKEAFLHSFTPSGEIGDNPQTPRIAESFYDSLNDLVGASGSVSKILGSGTNSSAVKKNRQHRFKSSVVNLIQIYLEAAMGLRTNDRPKVDRKTKRMRNTSFNYPQLDGKRSDEDYKKLIEVEMNRYMRLFVATVFFSTVSELFLLKIKDMATVIGELDLLGVKGISTPAKQFKHLREPATRRAFIENVRNVWQLELKATQEKTSRKKVEKKAADVKPTFIDLPDDEDMIKKK